MVKPDDVIATEAMWASIVGQPVERVDMGWTRGKKRTHVLAIEIHFAHRSVHLSATGLNAEIRIDATEPRHMTDADNDREAS